MELNWLESILYSFISGVSEFLPVSSRAHQGILRNLFGCTTSTTLLDFCIHLGCLIAVYIQYQSAFAAISRTSRLLSIPAHRRKRQPDRELVAELKYLRTATVPALLMIFLTGIVGTFSNRLNILSITLILNGIVLYISGHIPIGNKKSSLFNGLESLIIGISSGLGIIPGISRMGMTLSISTMRGTSTQNALRLGLLLSIPVLAGLCIADFVFIFISGAGITGFLGFLQCIIGGGIAYVSAVFTITSMQYIATRTNFSWLSYYCWGLGLFAFLLFMI